MGAFWDIIFRYVIYGVVYAPILFFNTGTSISNMLSSNSLFQNTVSSISTTSTTPFNPFGSGSILSNQHSGGLFFFGGGGDTGKKCIEGIPHCLGLHFCSEQTGKISIVFDDIYKFNIIFFSTKVMPNHYPEAIVFCFDFDSRVTIHQAILSHSTPLLLHSRIWATSNELAKTTLQVWITEIVST